MKREWYFTGRISLQPEPTASQQRLLREAEDALRANPNSRDRHRSLVRALAAVGQLERGLDVSRAWIERDRLDPEPLVYRANFLAQQGRRREALRVLSGVVDLTPDDEAQQLRLAEAFERVGDDDRACAHRVSLGELSVRSLNDAAASDSSAARARNLGQLSLRPPAKQAHAEEAVGQALTCLARRPTRLQADLLLDRLASTDLRGRLQQAPHHAETRFVGNLTLDASWDRPEDLDLALIDGQGNRLSFLGGRRNLLSLDAGHPSRERLGLRWAAPGTYRIEITRAETGSTAPVSGSIEVRVHGERQRLPFTLRGQREAVGRVEVRRESRLVPVSGPLPFR